MEKSTLSLGKCAIKKSISNKNLNTKYAFVAAKCYFKGNKMMYSLSFLAI